jgi:hypothetical protein
VSVRALFFYCAVASLVFACDRSQEARAPEEETPLSEISIAGQYDVSGVTVDKASGTERDIRGTVILDRRGSKYTATFSLKTTYPSRDGLAQAEVIGTGLGDIEGNRLQGTADIQLVMAAVPGVDPKFAYVPRIVGPRLHSTSVARFDKEGLLVIEIDNEGIEGEQYSPTRTTLRGSLIPR